MRVEIAFPEMVWYWESVVFMYPVSAPEPGEPGEPGESSEPGEPGEPGNPPGWAALGPG